MKYRQNPVYLSAASSMQGAVTADAGSAFPDEVLHVTAQWGSLDND